MGLGLFYMRVQYSLGGDNPLIFPFDESTLGTGVWDALVDKSRLHLVLAIVLFLVRSLMSSTSPSQHFSATISPPSLQFQFDRKETGFTIEINP